MSERANRVVRLLGPRRSNTAVPPPAAVLAELGLPVGEVVPPVTAHVPAVRAGAFVFTSGQLPIREGELLATGSVGDTLGVADGQACAQWCVLNALAAIKSEIGDLAQVKRVVKVVVYVASGALFTDQALVANGASELLGRLFGDIGQHARSAIGVSALPMDAPVELELVVEI
ncbi:Enamine deaminase RidA, house cleaning of reactive enamine intermediates, YjgF/YER057c/UK114 family [Nocardioides sp. YR527]|uniref:RidA family protein n=1 Tax=Nocardioides sp. YR527 TaxID=1881028 RepID=UPI00087E5693|nr:RidA family protein [Nocardioides sp. YR527]SDK67201.1 Enamine deaminase RidA, house cleaning of reactive enamine intermediates, YjgF/YER057c/UK114 family [Nocardioides sp. YR527]